MREELCPADGGTSPRRGSSRTREQQNEAAPKSRVGSMGSHAGRGAQHLEVFRWRAPPTLVLLPGPPRAGQAVDAETGFDSCGTELGRLQATFCPRACFV